METAMNITEEQHQPGTHKFLTPCSMPCTHEQFEKDLRGPLDEIGYNVDLIHFFNHTDTLTCCNNLVQHVPYIPNFTDSISSNILYLKTYNPEHFLALAARTDKPEGIPGEWWMCIDDFYKNAKGSLYKLGCTGYANLIPDFKKTFRKATVEEINRHFEKEDEKLIFKYICDCGNRSADQIPPLTCGGCSNPNWKLINETLDILNQAESNISLEEAEKIKDSEGFVHIIGFGKSHINNWREENPDQLYRLKEEYYILFSAYHQVDGIPIREAELSDDDWFMSGLTIEALEKVEPEKKRVEVVDVTIKKHDGLCYLLEPDKRKDIEHFINGEFDQITALQGKLIIE